MRAAWCVVPVFALLAGCGSHPQSATKDVQPENAAQGGIVQPRPTPAPSAPEFSAREKVEPAAPAELAAGTTLRVRLEQSLDTARNRAGDRFEATLVNPVRHDGTLVLPKDTTFRGHLTVSKPSGRLRHRGYLGLTLDSFVLHGQTYRIATSGKTLATKSHKKRNLGLIGGVAGAGALIGGLAGGAKGLLIGAGSGAAAGTAGAALTGKKNIHLPAESVLTFKLRSPVRIRSEQAGRAAPRSDNL